MDTRVIGKNVLTLRKGKKVTQEQLASRAKVSRNYISMIERGEAENISEDIIRKLAWGLEISVEQLTGKPNETTGTVIPPSLREFAIKEGLPFETVDTLLKIPLRGKNPTSAKEWKELYVAIKPYISGK
jgi:transcriptional regulator with XRE-family HTH domain